MASPIVSSAEEDSVLGLSHRRILRESLEAPVFYLVHGRAGDSTLMWLFQRCIPEGSSIVSVQAPLKDPIGGYSWWQVIPGQKIDRLEALAGANLLCHFITQFEQEHCLAPKARVALGFSQGGAVLSLLLQQGNPLFDGIAMLASFVLQLQEKAAPRLSLPPGSTRIFWGHGSRDEVVSIERAREDCVLLRNSGLTVSFFEEEIGHKIGAKTFRELKNFCHTFSK